MGEFRPWLSDHCPLHYSISLQTLYPLKSAKDEEMGKNPPLRFKWDDNTKTKFEEYLKSPSTKALFENAIGHDEPTKLVENFTETLLQGVNGTGIRPIKTNRKKCDGSPWFDNECKEKKREVARLAKGIKQSPEDVNLRERLYCSKRAYKSLCKKKKSQYQLSIIEEMHKNGSDPKKFWQLVKKLSMKGGISQSNIGISKWADYFKNLLNNEGGTQVIIGNDETGPLDFPITPEELKAASIILKAGKSPGYDGVSNEMIMCVLKYMPDVLLSFFNSIFNSGGSVPAWSLAIIVPIHKSGSTDDPSNFRGISLVSCLSKLFYSIINKRLLKYCIDNGVLTKNQLGFVPGNRTSDAHLILHNLIQNYCHINENRLYACFIDFSKAFDRLPRDILFQKLHTSGIKGKILNVIKNLYANDKACIKSDNKLSSEFTINQGVRQGCVLSPLLFNIFMSDLAKKLENDNKVAIGTDTSINSIFWADDLLLLSESEAGLNSILSTVGVYSEENRLKINYDKSKCMIFNKNGRLLRNCTFHIGGQKLENVRGYKYLGLTFTPSGEITTALEDLRSRGMKAYMGLKDKLGAFFSSHPSDTIKLFDTCVKPILLYGSEYWGNLVSNAKSNPIEKLHLMFCKHLLGVQRRTTTEGVLLELGRVPLSIHANKAATKNWVRIMTGNANYYVTKSIENLGVETLWCSKIKSKLSVNGMGYTHMDNEYANAHVKLFSQQVDIFNQSTLNDIAHPDRKLRTYSLIKEDYIESIQNVKHRSGLPFV